MRQKLLIVDDAAAIHALVRARLASEELQITSATDGLSGLEAAERTRPDVVLLDVDMPGIGGFEVCRRLRERMGSSAPLIIFLTATSAVDEKIRGLDLGAVDYITKPFDAAELRARVAASLRTKYMIDLLAEKAMVDALTGLWNRAYLEQRLVGEVSLARRSGRPLSCVMADLDRFKRINDEHGHPVGDEVLRRAAAVFQHECREEDVVCRYGGEELIVLTPNVAVAGAVALAERLRAAIERMEVSHNRQRVPVTCSLGVAEYGQTRLPLIESADEALYQAKAAGRNRVVCHCVSCQLPVAS